MCYESLKYEAPKDNEYHINEALIISRRITQIKEMINQYIEIKRVSGDPMWGTRVAVSNEMKRCRAKLKMHMEALKDET